MSYIQGFVAAVPEANKQAYIDHAKAAWPFFRDLGATQMLECWEADVPEGEVTSFSMAVKRKDDEKVIFSWIVWPSREAHDTAWQKMMSDPDMSENMGEMPFDGKRMIFGGFDPVVECRA
ncbi:MAG: DUF1428 domain-containing protein [Rubricella sp.]